MKELRQVESQRCVLSDVCDANAYKIRIGELRESGWRLDRPDHVAIIVRLANDSIPLHEYIGGHALFGLKTGLNKAFIVDREEKREIVQADPKSEETIKPILFGRDIRRYQINDAGRHVIYSHPTNKVITSTSIANHLRQHRSALRRRAGSQEWFELQQPAVALIPYLEQPKIVYPIIANECRFALDTDGFFVNDKSFILPSVDIALLAVLNSRVSSSKFRRFYAVPN